MKTPDWKRSELLDDVLAAEHGSDLPAESSVIGFIRREKMARTRRRYVGGAVACTALIIAAMTLVRQVEESPEAQVSHLSSESVPLVATEAALPGIEIEQIGDEQLLRLLEDQPAALVQFPDGERRLMLVVGSHSSAAEF